MAATMSDAQRSLLYLFELPSKPLFVPRAGGSVMYNVDSEMEPGMVPMSEVGLRFGGAEEPSQIEVPAVTASSKDLGSSLTVPRGTPFSMFIQGHRKAARDLCDYFMKASDHEELLTVSANVRNRVNENLFVYALSYTILRKQEFRGIRVPSIVEVFPDMFLSQQTMAEAKEKISMRTVMADQTMTVINGREFSGTELNPEQRLAYFREDYGINAHHWHWHLVYPTSMNERPRDRKGELFYYMHQQVLARYDMERLSVQLNRVLRLENLREPIIEGYFSKLNVGNTGRPYGSRPDNTMLKNFTQMMTTEQGIPPIDIRDMEQWRHRIYDAIHHQYLINREGEHVPLSDDVPKGQKRGIDILGDVIEADSGLTLNDIFYGDLHNAGHVLIGFCHDPDNWHKENIGVMGNTATALRDPVFYRWHKFVDDMFQEYKMLQVPYTEGQLRLAKVVLEKLGVATGISDELHTGWNTRVIEASRGIDFEAKDARVMVQLTHLDHEPFTYHFLVNNKSKTDRRVTVRVFLAPKENERGQTMQYLEQRSFWAEMDKFTQKLKPGKNHFQRPSSASSITIPSELTFRDIEAGKTSPDGMDPEADYCGCGWPQHLLVPRGRPEGMTFQLFVILTDWEEDKVDEAPPRRCTNAASFCGILDGKFPDSRPMGFPFDRQAPVELLGQPVVTVADMARIENAAILDVTVRFLNKNLSEK